MSLRTIRNAGWRLACLLGFALWAWARGILVEAVYYQCLLGGPLRAQLGFQHGSPYVCLNGREREVFTIESMVPGGVFAQAGFQPGDIVRELSITGFYRLLCRRRGQEVSIQVVEGGDGPPLEERPVWRISFVVGAGG